MAFAFSGVERFDTQLVTSTGLFIDAEEFEDDSVVHLEGFNTLNYQMPQFLGDDFTLTGQNGSNLVAPPTAGGTDMTLDGTAGPTALSPLIGVTNVEFTGIANVNISVPLGATNDTFTIDSTGGYADGLRI